MKKILLEGDVLVLDGKEFSYSQLTNFLTERVEKVKSQGLPWFELSKCEVEV